MSNNRVGILRIRITSFTTLSLAVGLTASFAIGLGSARAWASDVVVAASSGTVATYAYMDDTVSPADIRDGVVNVIDPAEIQDLLAWATNSKTNLEDGLKQVDKLPRSERHAALKTLIQGVIASSGDTSTELLMRSVLRRAIRMDGFIDVAAQSPERETLSIELLQDSANWAIELYPSDRGALNAAAKENKSAITVDLDFVDLGIQSGQYVLNHLWLSPSLTARLVLVKESLSYFFNDLNRDNVGRRNPTIANVLVKIANFAQTQGLTQTTPQYLQSVSSENDIEKQNLARQIEAFYQDMIDEAKTAQISRPSTNGGGSTIAGPSEGDSVNGRRASVTGAVFTRDTSIPALGEAYRDPSGLIWGDVATNSQGKVKSMTQDAAEKYCKSIGARLPTKEEFEQLARYLGYGTAKGYDPYFLMNGRKTEILPGLAYWFWSASVFSGYRYYAWVFYGYAWVFYGDNGSVYGNDRSNNSGAVRCVGR